MCLAQPRSTESAEHALVEVTSPQEPTQEFYLSCWGLIRGQYCDDNILSLYRDGNCENEERLHQIARIVVGT
jgi:hypothetical protein